MRIKEGDLVEVGLAWWGPDRLGVDGLTGRRANVRIARPEDPYHPGSGRCLLDCGGDWVLTDRLRLVGPSGIAEPSDLEATYPHLVEKTPTKCTLVFYTCPDGVMVLGILANGSQEDLCRALPWGEMLHKRFQQAFPPAGTFPAGMNRTTGLMSWSGTVLPNAGPNSVFEGLFELVS